jgi:hypothetical protein
MDPRSFYMHIGFTKSMYPSCVSCPGMHTSKFGANTLQSEQTKFNLETWNINVIIIIINTTF